MASNPESCVYIKRKKHISTENIPSFSKAVATGSSNWHKALTSSIGSSRLSPNGNYLLIDNLTSGFDIYSYPTLTHIETFKIPRAQSYLLDGTFMEGSTHLCCGSDHGLVYVISSRTFSGVQQLRAGTRKSMIQAIDVRLFGLPVA